MNLKFIMIIS